ncbi:hypothetical protein ACOMHN_064761 [Nucella lapillus]
MDDVMVTPLIFSGDLSLGRLNLPQLFRTFVMPCGMPPTTTILRTTGWLAPARKHGNGQLGKRQFGQA